MSRVFSRRLSSSSRTPSSDVLPILIMWSCMLLQLLLLLGLRTATLSRLSSSPFPLSRAPVSCPKADAIRMHARRHASFKITFQDCLHRDTVMSDCEMFRSPVVAIHVSLNDRETFQGLACNDRRRGCGDTAATRLDCFCA